MNRGRVGERFVLAVIVLSVGLFLLLSCGGGSGDADISAALAPQRHDLLYGYFNAGDDIAGVSDHVNVIFEQGWGNGSSVQHLMQAQAQGIPHAILAVDWRHPGVMRFQFDSLRAANVLQMVIALYPQDEPDLTGGGTDGLQPMSDAEVLAMIATVRATAAEFPALADVNLAVIYSNSGRTPGISGYDWVGRDDYGRGPQIVQITAGQKLILVPGGANPWKESPDAFIQYAGLHEEVVAIIPFLWTWPDGRLGGICDNGLAPAYRAAGVAITH